MALATDTPMAMVPTPPTTLDTTTARGRLSLRPMPTLATMAILVLDTMAMVPTPMLTLDTTTARGRLRLSLRLMAMDTEPTNTPVPTPTVATAVDTTGDKSSDQATI